ncbi:protein YIPF6 [Hyposmocoma kahamanoa]|uniref:protein YIPF6 n=1 Tax=Hyposmocoma kahamanoa TaxID=1477025 RepID=UPI000E6D84ED|nr:protein YIPF6 [Hyposmocoma kahamanoa]
MTSFDVKYDMYPAGDVGVGMVEGEMNIPGSAAQNSVEFNTLDEPIKETFLRDLRAVGNKFFHVLIPREKTSLLKEWDLWGPLLLCTLMATILQGSAERADNSNDGGPEFAEVFVLVWIGATVVTFNSKLLGGNISFFQSVCVLGYCLLPIAMALIVCRIILFSTQSTFLFFLRLVISIVGYVWATFAATKFLGDSQPEGKKALAVYPICLFYFILSWLVVSHSNV